MDKLINVVASIESIELTKWSSRPTSNVQRPNGSVGVRVLSVVGRMDQPGIDRVGQRR